MPSNATSCVAHIPTAYSHGIITFMIFYSRLGQKVQHKHEFSMYQHLRNTHTIMYLISRMFLYQYKHEMIQEDPKIPFVLNIGIVFINILYSAADSNMG